MSKQHAIEAIPFPRVDRNASFLSTVHRPGITEESLPFTVKIVQSEQDLLKAVHIRHAAYARHMPGFAETLKAPEATDFQSDVVVLLAESKLDGSPLGTARIHTNRRRPLSLEQSVELPMWLKGRRLVEVTRLGIDGGRIGRLAKIVLIKACFMYCEQNDVEWALVAGREPIDRQYEQLLFQDVFPGAGFIPMRHANNVPHRVMAFEIKTGHARWTEAGHPLLDFFSYTHHVDIDIGASDGIRSNDMRSAQNFLENMDAKLPA